MYISIILLYPLTEDKNTAYIHVCLNLVRVQYIILYMLCENCFVPIYESESLYTYCLLF